MALIKLTFTIILNENVNILQVDFDKTKHLSDRSIKKRRMEREKLEQLEREREEKVRKEREEEEKRIEEEKQISLYIKLV